MNKILLFSLSILCCLFANTQELLTSSRYPLSGVGLGSTIFMEDPLKPMEVSGSHNVDRRFRLELVYNRNTHSDIVGSTNWRLTMTVKNIQTSQEEPLTVEFTPSGTSRYVSWADFKTTGQALDYNMTWSVTQMVIEKYSSGSSSWVSATIADLPLADIHLEAQVFNDRIVKLSNTGPKLSILNGNQLSWTHVDGGIEYDVEWVFIHESDQFTYSTAQSPFDFREPVRITTFRHSHLLDLVYPKGTLYFRVRARGYVFKGASNKEVYSNGSWSYAKKTGSGNMSLAITTDFESKKTWLYNVVYSDNGLAQSSMTYYDGSLRERQQLTQQKSTGQVVAEASLYDYEGRPSVQVIPTPVNTNSLNYYNNLHRDAAGGAFDKSDFDLGTSAPMGTASGAGRYYSSDNDLTDPFKAQIPNAEGYPYFQGIVSNDNLGRPKVGSGFGLTHRIGGNHENYFYYVKPTDRDLRELFGSNVGDLSHYDKQVLVDMNGQASTTYTDQYGRIVATGLMNEAPQNLVPLDNNPAGVPITTVSSLMPMNQITTDANGNLQSVVDYTHLNLGTNTITLTYDLVHGGINSIGEYFGTSCASCFYELEIRVFAPNGSLVDLAYNSQTVSGSPMNVIRERYSADQLNCASPSFDPALAVVTKTLTLSQQGEYRIQKTLRVDQQAVANYISTTGMNLPGAPDLNDYLDSYLLNVVTTGCGFDCQSYYEQECREDLGLPITGPSSAFTTQQQTDLANCIGSKCSSATSVDGVMDEISDDPAQCDMLLNVLKTDVSPGGWVFETDAVWRANSANWDHNYVKEDGSGNFNPTSLADLEANWETSWWNNTSLIASHPEYCHYQKCVTLSALKGYLYTINSVTSLSAAQPVYINGSGDMIVSNDPISGHPLYSSGFSSFLSGLNNNFQGTGGSIYDYVLTMISSYPDLFKDASGVLLPNPSTALDNRIWMYVRSIYMGEREKYIEQNYSPSCAYLDNPNANFIDPQINTPGANPAMDYIGAMDGDCGEICSNNVAVWMSAITADCDNLTQTQLNTIQNQLQSYCLSDCDGLSNMFGSIQMSDILNGNTYLQAVQGVLTSASCSLNLSSMAVDDTCSNPQTITYPGVMVLGSINNARVSLLTSLAADLNGSVVHYNQFFTSPLIYSLANAATLFSYAHWTSTNMQIRLVNGVTTLATYNVQDLTSIEIVNYTISGINLSFNIKVTLLNGTTVFYTINSFGLRNSSGSWNSFELDKTSGTRNITYEYCAPDLSPYDEEFSLQEWVDDCVEDVLAEATTLANVHFAQDYENFINGLALSFSTSCFGGNLQEQFSITYGKCEYYYTLYYYDQAGNLVQTVPPAGVHITAVSGFNAQGVWDGVTQPTHRLKTNYTYNSLNQLFKTNTPDGGVSQIWYNSAQQPRFSQTASQLAQGRISYSKYDALGRSVESGEFGSTPIGSAIGYVDVNTYPTATTTYPNYSVIKTVYHKQTLALNSALGWNPKDLNNRVAAVLAYESHKGVDANYDNAIFYNYDIMGNVKQLLTDIPLMGANNRYKTIDYQYDVYSGNMLKVTYQKEKEDQLLHRYSYDDDNRLVTTQTSRDGVKWDMDAQYYYYLHGPLARTELGEDKVQGLDYAYTLQGWLKGVNSNSLVATRDMGRDGGTQTHKNRYVAQDAFGYSLTYYNSETEVDYKPIVTPSAATNWLSGSENAFLTGTTAQVNLYNGNIRAMVTAIRKPDNNLLGNVARVYKYDQLNRLKEAQTYTATNQVANNNWTGALTTNAHFSSYSYDLNGNINAFNRRNDAGNWMDQMSYGYDKSGTELVSNRLYHIDEPNSLSGVSTDDIDYMGTMVTGINVNHPTLGNNYVYDASGRLIKDKQEQIESIVWNAQSKVSKIIRSPGSIKSDLEFRYNGMGHRVVKIVKPKNANGTINTAQIKTTYYSLDAQDNLIATYTQMGDVATTFASTGLNNTAMMLEDFHLYGASRLGIQVVDKTLSTTANVSFTSSDNRASALLRTTLTTYSASGTTYVQYRLGTGTLLNDPYAWNTALGLDANVNGLLKAINSKTVATDVSASLWYDKNASGTVYIELMFGQPGNWLNQTLTVLTGATASVADNNALTTGAHMARQFGYGVNKGTVTVGTKRYELINHLGNVLATISDRKWGVDDGVYTLGTGVKTSSSPDKITDYYISTILTYSDYDPFGTQQSGRFGGEDYRYGFNGMEEDLEVKGQGNSYTTEWRQYDPRLGRWLSMEPLAAEMPSQSPYSFANNNPIYGSDPDGDICLPCMLLNGLLDFGGQILGGMAQGMSFSESLSEVSWWSVGWSVLEGASPGGVAKTIAKFVKNPVFKPFIDEIISAVADAIGEYIDDGNFSTEQYLKTLLYGKAADKVTKGIKTKKAVNYKKALKQHTRTADRAKRMAGKNARQTRKTAAKDMEKKVKKTEQKLHYHNEVPAKIVKETYKAADKIGTKSEKDMKKQQEEVKETKQKTSDKGIPTVYTSGSDEWKPVGERYKKEGSSLWYQLEQKTNADGTVEKRERGLPIF
ncbi:hypothetical protein D3C87_17080 [compost metagenome]